MTDRDGRRPAGERVADGGTASRTDRGERTEAAATGRDERAPGATSALVLAVSVGAAAVLAARVGTPLSVAVAGVAGVAFAAGLRLVDRDRYRVVAASVAGVLALFVGSGVAVAVGYAALSLVADLYPVASVARIRPRGLTLASRVLVVVGATLAVVGGVASTSPCRRETAESYAVLSVKTLSVPLAAGAALLAPKLLSQPGATPLAPALRAVGDAVGAVLDPVPGRTHLFTFLILVAATARLLALAVDRLPVAAVEPESRRRRVAAAVDRVGRHSRRVGAAAAGLAPLAVVEFVAPPRRLRGILTPPAYDLLAGLTGAGALRVLAALVLVTSLSVVAVVWALRRAARATPRDVAHAWTPFVGGGLVVALVALTHSAAVDPAFAFVVDSLPGAFAAAFERQGGAILEFFGSAAVGMVLAATAVGLTAAGSLALALAASAESVPDGAVGPGLAAAGVFVAAAFAGGAGVAAPVVVAGLVASFVVWDAGEYGVGLGREVGRGTHAAGPTAVHLAGTLAVGAVGAAAVFAVASLTAGASLATGPTLPVVFGLVLVGLALTAAALR